MEKGKTNNPNGRPKGAKGKLHTGLTFNARMKVLQQIIMNKEEKSSDRLMAIKTMTDMLQDKIKASSSGMEETVIRFDLSERPDTDIVKKQVIKKELPVKNDAKPIEHSNNCSEIIKKDIVEPIVEPIVNQVVTNVVTKDTENKLEEVIFDFNFENDKDIKDE